MSGQAILEDTALGAPGRACLHCPAYELRVCRAAVKAQGSRLREPVEQRVHAASARRVIFRYQDLHDVVPIICDGWASRDVRVPGGGRMILSFFLPGDLMGDMLFVEPLQKGFIEAITNIHYTTFERRAFRRVLFANNEVLEKVLRRWAEEKSWSDRMIVDLGRRSAELRITRMIMRLAQRLKARELENSDARQLAFPLRHRHIADATGLSAEHVTKVLSELRRREILIISDRRLTVLDPVALHRIAGD